MSKFIRLDSGAVINADSIRRISSSNPENRLCEIAYDNGSKETICEEEAARISQILLEDNYNNKGLLSAITRLVTAIDRLGVRIPSSIRMHM